MGRTPRSRHSARLRAAWCRRSRAMTWEPRDEWWHPAVEDVSCALTIGGDLPHACTELGRARAQAGVPIGGALDDFAALSAVMGWDAPPMYLIKALTAGWAETGEPAHDYYDPLTGLVTSAYLRMRITELYRIADPHPSPSVTHRLIIVALDSVTNPWRRTAGVIVVSHKLARTFDGGETIACLSEQRFGVVAAASIALDGRVDQLRRALFLEHGAAVWDVSLPTSVHAALDLLHDVGQPAMTE